MSLPISLVPLHSEIFKTWYCSSLWGSRAHSTFKTCTNLCCAMPVNKKPLWKPDVHTPLLERGWAEAKREQACRTLVVCNTLMGCIPQPQIQGYLYFCFFTLFLYTISFSGTWVIDGEKSVPPSSKDTTNLLYHYWSRKSIRSHQIRWEWRGENLN